ncbi:protein FAM200A-like [Palaemon carinicauda]|uniref:protein FAM200A-like n=1 Tax=Palaemon carinicauda TaxID=392227 RepID=UPI0035B59C52
MKFLPKQRSTDVETSECQRRTTYHSQKALATTTKRKAATSNYSPVVYPLGEEELLGNHSVVRCMKTEENLDPFNTEIEPTEDEAEELAELKVSKAMKLAFSNREDLSSFWLSVQDAYPLLSKKASEMHVQFATIYLCESGFSDLATIKTKSRNRLDVGNDIRLAVSKTEPDIRGLVTRAQQQVSH